jgi:PrtD family type I secretion system ABC transporter
MNLTKAESPTSPRAGGMFADATRTVRRVFVTVGVYSLAINLLAMGLAFNALALIDRAGMFWSEGGFGRVVLVTVIAVVALVSLDALRQMALLRAGVWIERRLGGPLLAGHMAAATGQRGSPCVDSLRDLAALRLFLVGPSAAPMFDAPWAAIFIVAVFWLHPLLGAVALLGAAAVAGAAWANDRLCTTRLAAADMASARARRHAEAASVNAEVAETMGMTPDLVRRWYRHNADALALHMDAGVKSILVGSAGRAVAFLALMTLVGTGGVLMLGQQISAGTLVAATLLLHFALTPAQLAMAGWRSLADTRNAFRRIERSFRDAPARAAGGALPVVAGGVHVESLAFAYRGDSEPVLRGVSLSLEPGETLAIIGPAASGKTTLARLLAGSLRATSGRVRLDGVNLGERNGEELGQHIGYLPQDVALFNGSVRENIARMGVGDPAAVITAARAAGAHETIMRLPDGYDTEIGDYGVALSGSQRRLIALARALYGEPRLLVLDEPDAGLDLAGREGVVQAVAAAKARGAIVIAVAVSPTIIRHMDKILVLVDGSVQMFGPRDGDWRPQAVETAPEPPRRGGPMWRWLSRRS